MFLHVLCYTLYPTFLEIKFVPGVYGRGVFLSKIKINHFKFSSRFMLFCVARWGGGGGGKNKKISFHVLFTFYAISNIFQVVGGRCFCKKKPHFMFSSCFKLFFQHFFIIKKYFGGGGGSEQKYCITVIFYGYYI